MSFSEHPPNGSGRSNRKKHSWLLKGFLLPLNSWCIVILHRKLSCHVMHRHMGLVQFRHIDWQMDPKNQSALPLGHSNAGKKCSEVEKEGLAYVFGVKRFHVCLYGHSFTLITDHKALLALFSLQWGIPPQASARIQRWALTMVNVRVHHSL